MVFTAADGSFELTDVPAADLYMWCRGAPGYRGGVARIPSQQGDRPVRLWGLDVRGKPLVDEQVLGFSLVDDYVFAKQVAAVDPKGAAARAGLRVGDVIETVGDKSMEEVGNGLARAYLLYLLADAGARVRVVVDRAGEPVPLVFALHAAPAR